MKLTSNYGLKKPEGTDPVDVQDFNDNADKLDAELKKRPESDGDASDMTVGFAEATQLTELTSNDSLGNLFSKLKLAVKNVISLINLLGSTDISTIGDGTATGAISELNTNLTPQDIQMSVRANRITIIDAACYFTKESQTAHIAVCFKSNITGTLPLFDIPNRVRRTQALTCVDYTNDSSPILTPSYASANSEETTSIIATVVNGNLYSINSIVQVYTASQ